MPSVVSTKRAARIRSRFRDLEDTMQVVFWDVAWTAYRLRREKDGTDTWDNGKKGEEWPQAASGTGRLSPNGSGGPTIGDGLIYLQAPYRLRCRVDDRLEAGMRLVIEDRLFKVEFVEDRSGERQHCNAYLTEIFGEELPGVTP